MHSSIYTNSRYHRHLRRGGRRPDRRRAGCLAKVHTLQVSRKIYRFITILSLSLSLSLSIYLPTPSLSINNFNSRGFVHLGAGLSVGLSGLAAGYAVGIVGDAGVRGTAQQPRWAKQGLRGAIGGQGLFVMTNGHWMDIIKIDNNYVWNIISKKKSKYIFDRFQTVRGHDPDPYLRWGPGSLRSHRSHLPLRKEIKKHGSPHKKIAKVFRFLIYKDYKN